MKTNLFIELNGRKVLDKKMFENVKEIWKNEGHMVKDMKSVDIYYNATENMCYYVINGKVEGKFEADIEE